MISGIKLLTPTLATSLLTVLMSGCGGAPGSDIDDDDTNDGNIVNFAAIPTSISLGFSFSTSGTADTVGTVAGASVLLANVVGNEAFDGQIVEFVTSRGIIEDTCMVEGTGCGVNWTSASSSVRPNSTMGTTAILAIVPGAAEPFVDLNGNSLYDPGIDTFDTDFDYSEPFLDADGDGTWGAEEFFFDQNNDGMWNDANGEWDGPCSLTTDTTCDTEAGIAIFDQDLYPLLTSDGTLANPDLFCPATGGSSIIEDLCELELEEEEEG